VLVGVNDTEVAVAVSFEPAVRLTALPTGLACEVQACAEAVGPHS
jgi:hypothetical protein